MNLCFRVSFAELIDDVSDSCIFDIHVCEGIRTFELSFTFDWRQSRCYATDGTLRMSFGGCVEVVGCTGTYTYKFLCHNSQRHHWLTHKIPSIAVYRLFWPISIHCVDRNCYRFCMVSHVCVNWICRRQPVPVSVAPHQRPSYWMTNASQHSFNRCTHISGSYIVSIQLILAGIPLETWN